MRQLPARDVAIVAALVVTWWMLRLALPSHGAWGVVQLVGGLVITVLTVLMGVRLWRHITARDPTWGKIAPGAAQHDDRPPSGPPQSTTTGSAPHH